MQETNNNPHEDLRIKETGSFTRAVQILCSLAIEGIRLDKSDLYSNLRNDFRLNQRQARFLVMVFKK